MATRVWTVPNQYVASDGTLNYSGSSETSHWGVSPTVNGKLQLRSNPCNMRVRTKTLSGTNFDHVRRADMGAYVDLERFIPQSQLVSAQNQALSRMRGRLYSGSAALGVTLGSYSQSRDMVIDRYKTLNGDITRRLADLSDDLARGRHKKGAQRFAGTHLEVIFGWQPLISDIVASTTTVINNMVPVTSVSGVGVCNIRHHHQSGGAQAVLVGTYRRKVSSMVTVTNHNLWLAERAGLLNPATVAWDLVPWSFLVNMFININSMVNQVTEYAGLTFQNESVTDNYKLAQTSTYKTKFGSGTAFRTEKLKTRSVGSIPRPSLEFKIPDLNWGTAAMAASLFTQKLSAFQRVGGMLINLSKKV